MIKKIEIAGVHTKVDARLRAYAAKKIGGCDRYLPRRMRASLHAEIKLKEGKSKDKNRYTCEVILHLPQEIVHIEECTINLYAAVDIVDAKLKQQLRKYKDLHLPPKLHRRMLARLKRQMA